MLNQDNLYLVIAIVGGGLFVLKTLLWVHNKIVVLSK